MIEIINKTKFKIDKKLFTGLAKKIIKGENKEIELKNISVTFVSPSEIAEINKKYRNKNNPTDVLSFEVNLENKFSNAEVIICPEVVKENCKKSKNTFAIEIKKVFVHGLLHTIGYDHEKSLDQAKAMENKEDYYLLKI